MLNKYVTSFWALYLLSKLGELHPYGLGDNVTRSCNNGRFRVVLIHLWSSCCSKIEVIAVVEVEVLIVLTVFYRYLKLMMPSTYI